MAFMSFMPDCVDEDVLVCRIWQVMLQMEGCCVDSLISGACRSFLKIGWNTFNNHSPPLMKQATL